MESDCPDEAALRLVGIARYSEHFEFSGSLIIILPDGNVDFSPLSYGGILTSDDVAAGSFSIEATVKRILSIENKANYGIWPGPDAIYSNHFMDFQSINGIINLLVSGSRAVKA